MTRIDALGEKCMRLDIYILQHSILVGVVVKLHYGQIHMQSCFGHKYYVGLPFMCGHLPAMRANFLYRFCFHLVCHGLMQEETAWLAVWTEQFDKGILVGPKARV
jgi:hypothetical protein